MPGYLAGPLSIPAHQSRHPWFSLRDFVVVLIIVAVIVILLGGPVVAGALYEVASKAGERAVPGTFFTGLGVLFAGIIVGIRIIDYIGLGLIAAVVLGVIIDNYLPLARRVTGLLINGPRCELATDRPPRELGYLQTRPAREPAHCLPAAWTGPLTGPPGGPPY